MNPLRQLASLGQSPWYDDLSRELLESGELARLVREDGIRGVTSNPSIFQKAIAGGASYDAQIQALARDGWLDAGALYEALAIRDIGTAADLLRAIYDESNGRDGFVSLEVSPHLARDAEATVAEALRLSERVARPNLMIKVPGTHEGCVATEELIARGVSVNVTLLFSTSAYQDVVRAWLAGLERLAASGGDVSRVASVASFFVSRIDAAVDRELEAAGSRMPARKPALDALRSKAAVANAMRAYEHFEAWQASARWRQLAERGAQPQRLLWASTSTKNPQLSSTLYVDTLIGPHTVTTLPKATVDAFRASGCAAAQLGSACSAWHEHKIATQALLSALEREGISLERITAELLEQGINLFADSFDALLAEVERRRVALAREGAPPGRASLGALEPSVSVLREQWRREGRVRRLYARDASLWTASDEARWLGWLDAPARARADELGLATLCKQLEPQRFDSVLLLGMGGSSLAPEVLAKTFGRQPGHPELRVIDSTVPAQLRRAVAGVDLTRSLIVIASKSGSTVEPNTAMAWLHGELSASLGEERAWQRFVAITDPGSSLERHARSKRFAAIALGDPAIGGRYSALSPFGLLPAWLLGLDVPALLDASAALVSACSANVPPDANPGVQLGLILGAAARAGRDKLTLLLSPALASLGAWLEQLIAESTGKRSTGIVVVDGERLREAGEYASDRLFVRIGLRDETDANAERLDRAADRLEAAGHPLLRWQLGSRAQLFGEMFCWEIATAVAASVLGVNPFDQPDVEAAKQAARSALSLLARGESPAPPNMVIGRTALHLDAALAPLAKSGERTLEALLATHLARLAPGGALCVNAFLASSPEIERELQQLRSEIAESLGVASCLGFGPRFLHSTGQLHKGGPAQLLFLQLSAREEADIPIPGERYGFRDLARAQAAGDFAVLVERSRSVLWLELDAPVEGALGQLQESVRRALASLHKSGGSR